MSSQQPSRRPTLHEKFGLSRRNMGFPAILTIAASYPSSSSSPSSAFLHQRIIELLDHFPMLYARVEGHRTPTPLQVLRAEPWAPEDVLGEGDGEYEGKEHGTAELQGVIEQEERRVAGEDIETRPLWQVRKLACGAKETVYLTLSVDHTITDGKGMLLLFQALTAPDISAFPYEKLETITRLDDTVPMRPSVLYRLPSFLHGWISAYLPGFVQPYAWATTTAWPGAHVRAPPTSRPPRSSLISLPAGLIAQLKSTARSHGLTTLHPTLHPTRHPTLHGTLKTAYALALYARFHPTHPSPASPDPDPDNPFIVRAGTPRSERDPALGHGHCTGNYVSLHQLDLLFTSSSDFWAYAQAVSRDLVDPASIQRGRVCMGTLGDIPSGFMDPPHPTDSIHRPTLVEDCILTMDASPTPYGESFGFSNLGYMRLPEGAQDLAWGQLPSPFGSALTAKVVGHEGGVRVLTVWRDGAAAEEEDVREIERVFVVVLERLVGDGRTTVGDLLEGL